MPVFASRKAPAGVLASQSQSSQEKRQSQPVCPWSARAPPLGQSKSPFLRSAHALSTSVTAAGELFLFGGFERRSRSISNDLYVISTRDFSATLLQTSGDVPSPRYGHRTVLTGTILLMWGGTVDLSNHTAQTQSVDDPSLYLLNLVSRKWTRIVVNGPAPGARYYHTMTLVGSKIFVFGGRNDKTRLNDIWALDLNCVRLNPFCHWEPCEPTPGSDKPLPRTGHVSVTTGDRIIIFGGCAGPHDFNDTWSFNTSTRKWSELQCTGSIPSPRTGHAGALVGDVMYVFGGRTTTSGTSLGDLTALDLTTQRWTAFQDIGPSPHARRVHAMASDGRRVFVLGGELLPDAPVDEALIYTLDTKLLIYPKPDPDEKSTQLATKLSAGHPTQAQAESQPQHGTFSSPDAGAAHGAFTLQMSTFENKDLLAPLQTIREQSPSLNGLPSQPSAGVDDKPRSVPQKDDNSERPTPRHPKLVAPNTASKEDVARLEHERISDLERRLSETLAAQTERDRHIAQLTDQLVQKSTLLEQAEANASQAKERAGLELRELRAKLDDLMQSRDENLRTLEQAQNALQKATSRAADANERDQQELAEVRAKLEVRESELAAVRSRLTDAENGLAERNAEADALRAGNQAATRQALSTWMWTVS